MFYNIVWTYPIGIQDSGSNSRLHDWTPTDRAEMTNCISLLGWIGLVKVPKLADYWSRADLYAKYYVAK